MDINIHNLMDSVEHFVVLFFSVFSSNASEYQLLISDIENKLPETPVNETINCAESLVTWHSQDQLMLKNIDFFI